MPWGIPIEFNSFLVEARKSAPPAPDDALYAWLSKVLRLSNKLSNMSTLDSQRILRSLERRYGSFRSRRKYRLLVASVCVAHVEIKMQRKYAAVLARAEECRVEPKNLRRFVQGQGGINSCSEKSASPAD